jgi:hypothetical protein
MLTCAHHPPIDAGTHDVLLRLARVLAEAAAADDLRAPRATDAGGVGSVVAVIGPLPRLGADPLDLAVRALDGHHPVEALVGFVAPDDWSAVGVVAPATAHHLDTAAGVTAPFDNGDRIVTAHLIARDGASASVGRRSDGSVWSTSAPSGVDQPSGRLDDVLRRALGLPTQPPPADSAELWARLWLDRVLAEVGGRPDRSWSWASLAVLHPAAQLVVDDLRGRVAEVVRAMPRLAEMLSRRRTWGDLRRDHLSGDWTTPSIQPDVARWMDDGIFSRWLLDGVPSCGETLVALRDLLPRRLVRRIEASLTGWQVSIAVDADPWLSEAAGRDALLGGDRLGRAPDDLQEGARVGGALGGEEE